MRCVHLRHSQTVEVFPSIRLRHRERHFPRRFLLQTRHTKKVGKMSVWQTAQLLAVSRTI